MKIVRGTTSCQFSPDSPQQLCYCVTTHRAKPWKYSWYAAPFRANSCQTSSSSPVAPSPPMTARQSKPKTSVPPLHQPQQTRKVVPHLVQAREPPPSAKSSKKQACCLPI